MSLSFFFSSRRRHTRCALVTGVQTCALPISERIEEADFIVFTCSLNAHNRHMLDAEVLARAKPGVLVVNVARGPLIDETALISALHAGRVSAAALDVFEEEPLPPDSRLRDRSEESRVGKECVSTCRSRGSPYP